MGCCSTSPAATNTQSPVTAPEKNVRSPHSENGNPSALRQHMMNASHDDESSDSSMQISRSFARNSSIAQEMMRLQEMELRNDIDDLLQNDMVDQNRTDFKSNENSEDIRNSFGEAASRSVTVDGDVQKSPPKYVSKMGEQTLRDQVDSYTPFGLIQTQKPEVEHTKKHGDREQDIDRLFKEEPTIQTKGEKIQDLATDLEALYAENLKQHGFDADKFRNANISAKSDLEQLAHNRSTKKSGSSDMSSFASSDLSSKSGTLPSIKSSMAGTGSRNLTANEFILDEEDDDDFMLQELSRGGGTKRPDVGRNEHDERRYERDERVGYIESIQQSMKDGGSINNIMDDDDEELMDAILSLDMDD